MLDNVQQILDQDKLDVFQATEMLSDQCQQAWKETQSITLPTEYKNITNAVVAGMGGSHLGAQMINAVYRTSMSVPLIIQNEYTNPGFINESSLVLATSFSGTTEEVMSFVKEAQTKKAKIICISSGGTLAEFAKENNLPSYVFESTYNPSRIPRYGSGYLFIAQLSLLAKAGVVEFEAKEVEAVINTIKAQKEKYTLTVPTANNWAKQLATDLKNKAAILVASEHLQGSAYIFKNQINESAKQFSTMFAIPELNHHLLEGLAHPEKNPDYLHFVMFQSNLYHDRTQKRYKITKEVIEKQHIQVSTFNPEATTPLLQAFETLSFTSYVALYLSILNKVDPGPNPWVDYLKESLGQPLGK